MSESEKTINCWNGRLALFLISNGAILIKKYYDQDMGKRCYVFVDDDVCKQAINNFTMKCFYEKEV